MKVDIKPTQDELALLKNYGLTVMESHIEECIFFEDKDVGCILIQCDKDEGWYLPDYMIWLIKALFPGPMITQERDQVAFLGLRVVADEVLKRGYPLGMTASVMSLMRLSEQFWQAYGIRKVCPEFTMWFTKCVELANSNILTGNQKAMLIDLEVDVPDIEADIRAGIPVSLAAELYAVK